MRRIDQILAMAIQLAVPIACSQAQAGGTDFELFTSEVPVLQIFQECSEAGPKACSFDPIVYARKIDPSTGLVGDGAELAPLPIPLRSLVLTNVSNRNVACPISLIKGELEKEKRKSKSVKHGGLALDLPSSVSDCYGFAIAGDRTKIILFWESGSITGWMSCDAHDKMIIGCITVIYPPTSAAKDNNGQVYVEISGIDPSAVSIFIKNLGSVSTRVSKMIVDKLGYSVDIPIFSNVVEFESEELKGFSGT